VPAADDVALAAGLQRIREELEVPAAFPPEVEAAASVAPAPAERDDKRDLPLVTLDPPGARDLDQAFALEAHGDGRWTVWYAIADVAAFVPDGGPVDAEARRRGVTLYLPDGRAPLHPPALSEGSASLLPGVDRPCLLWRLDIDGDGRLLSGRVRRALVHSRAQLDYPTAQADPPPLLREVGTILTAAEVARGGVNLPLPEQVVERRADGAYRLAWRTPLPIEGWNAQLSLLTGRAAANLMLQGGVGVLRTLPPFDPVVVDRLRRSAAALSVAWPGDYPAFVRSLDPASPEGGALLNQAARAMRGAGYVSFGPGVGPVPAGDDARHAAVAASYAHVTAPLRRLVDRFGLEVALAVSNHVDVPGWVTAALPLVPDLMAAARQREGAVTRAVLDLAEAVVLGSRIGETLDAVVVGTDPERGSDLQLREPPVRARMPTPLELGAEVRVRVAGADPVARRVDLELAT
jgi:exoribonuclease R